MCVNSFHLKCANVDLKPDWYCNVCTQTLFPFNGIVDDNEFINTVVYYSQLSMNLSTLEYLNKCVYNPFSYDRKRALLNNKDIDPDLNYFNTEIENNKCTYYLVEEFNNIAPTADTFSIMHINCNSLFGNFDNFVDLVDSVNNIFDVIAVSETHLNGTADDLVNLHGYTFINKNRTYKSKGGIGMYLKNNLSYKIRPDITSDNIVYELLAVEILNPLNKNIIVVVVYRPPGTDLNAFNTMIGSLCDMVRSENKLVYWAGDFNINLLNAESHKATNEFLNVMLSNSLYPAITKPTRISEHSATVIDNIYCNTVTDSMTGILYKEISDHLPIFIINSTKIKKLQTSNPILTRNLCAENISRLKHKLSSIDWSNVTDCSDVKLAYSNFVAIYSKHYNECCPFQSRKNVKKRDWMTPGLLKSRSTKERLFKKYQRSPH